MARLIGGKVSKILFFRIPVDAEVLGMDGKQVWYGDPEGLGSTTADDITGSFVEGSVEFSGSDEGEDS